MKSPKSAQNNGKFEHLHMTSENLHLLSNSEKWLSKWRNVQPLHWCVFVCLHAAFFSLTCKDYPICVAQTYLCLIYPSVEGIFKDNNTDGMASHGMVLIEILTMKLLTDTVKCKVCFPSSELVSCSYVIIYILLHAKYVSRNHRVFFISQSVL